MRQAREHAAALEVQQRAAAQERERIVAVEAQQRAATQARVRAAARLQELAAAAEIQLRAAAQERERAVAQEREHAVAVEAQQRAAAQERERAAAREAQQRAAALEHERATAVEAQQRAAAQERGRVATQARERAEALERERVAKQTRERAAAQERERLAALEAQQRAAAQERQRLAALEAQQRAAAQERQRAAALEAQQRQAAQERERTASQERERAAALAWKNEATKVPNTRPVVTPSVAAVDRPASRARVAQVQKHGNGDGELVALAKLLRCGPWPQGMKACDLITPDLLPAGAHGALQELAGTVTLNVRALGNALKRVLDKPIEGIPLKVTRTIDNHGFAIWQVVSALGETSTTSDRPGNAELLRGALTGMGYGPAEANHAISALRARLEIDSLTALVREALGVLALRPTSGSKPKRR